MEFIIRKPVDDDGRSIVKIFNYFVKNSFAAYPDKRTGSGFFTMVKKMAEGYPFYVVETAKGKVIGFGLLHAYHRAETMKRTAEISYFILPEYTRQGIGKRLLDMLIKDAGKKGITTIIASIYSKNTQSINFHLKYGFEECGRFKRIGSKFGNDFDMVWMQKFI